MKPQNVADEDWDYLLVLDACRYDAFERVYDDYLDGTLEKRRSPGSSTPEWAAKSFTDRHDLAYFSSNPFINGIGIPLRELPWGASCGYDWTATDHIESIVDLWQDAWDDEIGTVHPDAVNEAVLNDGDLQATHDRTVVHYMQPHAPYIVGGKGRKLEQIRNGMEAAENGDGGLLANVGEKIGPTIESILGDSEFITKMGMWFELDGTGLRALARDGTRATVERYYEQNLRLAMEAVAELVSELDGRVVVTADHGEAFGEEGVWEHHVETHIPVLVEVPWLVVD